MGAKWVFVVTGVSSEEADLFIYEHYVTFGIRTNDADNTAGSNLIASSPLVSGVPWVGVIRAADMQLVQAETDIPLDIRSIAEELSTTR
jgi:hypothetical protein